MTPPIDPIEPFDADAELRNWAAMNVGYPSCLLLGEIYNDRAGRWPDGTRIRTSFIQSMEADREGYGYAITRNTRYRLINKEQPA